MSLHTYKATLNYPDDMLRIIQKGLPNENRSKKIIVVGAGMSGLVAASLLKRAGHHVTILEGNDRVGGKVFTLRAPFTPGNYLELGAMRIPDNHTLVTEYIRRFHLPTNQFINSSSKDLIFVNNVLTTRENYEEHPSILNFPLGNNEKGKTATELFLSATQPFITRYEHSSFEQKELLRKQHSNYSMSEFLECNPEGPSLSFNAIRKINILLGIEGFPEYSFPDILTNIVLPIFRKETNFHEITGGNDQLPISFLPELAPHLLYNQKVTKIIHSPKGVSFETKNPLSGEQNNYDGDVAILTIPFTVLQLIDIVPYHALSFKKRQAIQELPSIPSVKIGIEFRTRFWERLQVGNMISDLPTRFTYIPSHDIGSDRPGILLASYSWGQNALLWNSMPSELIISYVLKDLAKVFGSQVYREYMRGVSFNWSQNPFSAGCFTLFRPGQNNDFGDFIRQPEGRLHFAGEHTSSLNGWIEGAVESGIRAAFEVNQRSV